jgi:lysophospholipase L1-like esterase
LVVVTTFTSYVALGDSFTEGLNDAYPGTETFRGWADRLAERLAAAEPGLGYANLAVRGKLLRQVVADQVPRAIELAPDLISFCAGGNDMLRPGSDPDALAEIFDAATVRLRATGAEVVLLTGFDPRDVPVLRRIRGKAAMFNLHLRTIADQRGCRLVDLWSMRTLLDPRAWSEDRLHMSADGHRRVALAAGEVLGLPVEADWREPFPPAARIDWLTSRRSDLQWARAYFVPWIQRRLRHRSSGDGAGAKRPDLIPL